MFWITVLAFCMSAALVKLGVLLVMVSVLTTALWATGAGLALLASLGIWQLRRR